MPIPSAIPNCPCCGRAIDEMADLRWNMQTRVLSGHGRTVALSPIRARMFGALWKNFKSGRPVERQEMMSVVYADDQSGGPESDNIISVQVVHLKKQIRPFGLSVKGRSGYQLVMQEVA